MHVYLMSALSFIFKHGLKLCDSPQSSCVGTKEEVELSTNKLQFDLLFISFERHQRETEGWSFEVLIKVGTADELQFPFSISETC